MIKIAICEDEKFFRDMFAVLLKQYFEAKGLYYRLDCYKKGEELLKTNHKKYDISFLDVEIKDGMDGIGLAEKMRKEENGSQIIFLTRHQGQVYKAFEVNAFRYLLKPLEEAILYETMDLVIEEIEKNKEDYIVFKVGKGFLKLQLQEILHIETYKRKLKVYTLGKKYLVNGTLRKVEDQLKDRCFVSHINLFLLT